MHERCPTCGMKFEREEGYFVGAYLINFAITEGLLFIAVMGFVLVVANTEGTGPGLTLPVTIGLTVAIIAPILFYPFARTIWSAIDLSMRPLELDEIVSAQEHLHDQVPSAADNPRDGPAKPLP